VTPGTDYETGYDGMKRNLNEALASYDAAAPGSDSERLKFVQDTAIQASEYVRNGYTPQAISAADLLAVEDQKQFESGMRRAIHDWSHEHNRAMVQEQNPQRQSAAEWSFSL
jgi:hypothetical protein